MTKQILTKLQHNAEQNITDIENHKKAGNKVIGFYCLYSPIEIAVAANAVPLSLCGTKDDPISAAEEVLPRNLCPLIKSSYGFAVTDTCPYFKYADLIIADTTCDGKKKMFEIMNEIKPVHVLQLPQNQDFSISLDPWKKEIEKMILRVEKLTQMTITHDKIKKSIKLLNKERKIRKALMDVAKAKPSPIKGTQLIEILFKSGFFADKIKGMELMKEIVEQLHQKISAGESPFTEKTPRILLSGVPVGLGSDKVIKILEQSGANVVCFENCSGYKQIFQVDEEKDPVTALAEKYLDIPCSVMSPNKGRFDLIKKIADEFSVDGVVDLTWQACHTYNIEAFNVGKFVRSTLNIPYLHLETDYSESDTEQLRVRIEAFLEMI